MLRHHIVEAFSYKHKHAVNTLARLFTFLTHTADNKLKTFHEICNAVIYMIEDIQQVFAKNGLLMVSTVLQVIGRLPMYT